ncbi:molybdenum cofactor guanylyltransferase [Nesterenkonia lutea]|uniref:Molybdopterin-guanine dinucleotide biosynthesis protein A n=1 Tax=Nesterenkonia lutea TaxID=272919 RepID=A0ABR9JAG8_9MICC|nr:NTP transferase domain-containing protein [Nesterenkonia lutea]MBE1522922.1 molybdopterin-guanine dinucleotide biosynthesis protein A [Nesterenkonia lutea]
MPAETRLQAVLLAGGTGRRLGGLDKALLTRGGRTQLSRWLDELQRRHIPAAVVGPGHLRSGMPEEIDLVQEAPPFSGPAAGIVAGVSALQQRQAGTETTSTLLLAVDLALPGPLLDWLLAEVHAGASPAAVLPQDESGRHQHLCAVVPTAWLNQRVNLLRPGQAEQRPVRWLMEGLQETVTVAHPLLPAELSADIDTVEDAHRWGIQLP